MLVIGICGAPAGGKSTVAEFLRRLGAHRVDADRIAHDVLQQPESIAALVRRFGPSILASDGKIDRPRLANRVFGDDARSETALKYVESVVHPATRRTIIAQLAAAIRNQAPAVVLDIPLLFESGWDASCDEVWFIDTPAEVRLRAARRRGWSEDELRRRETRQWSAADKRRRATRVVPNSCDPAALQRILETLWRDIIGRDRAAPNSAYCPNCFFAAELPRAGTLR